MTIYKMSIRSSFVQTLFIQMQRTNLQKGSCCKLILVDKLIFLPLLRFAQTQTLPYANSRKGGRSEAKAQRSGKNKAQSLVFH